MPTSNGYEHTARAVKARKFVIYDGRAISGDTDSASVYCTEDSLRAAKRSAFDFGESAIYSYEVGADNVLTDERLECVTDPSGRVRR